MTGFARRDDWEQQLMTYLAEEQSTPFVWGVNDCGHFSAAAVARMTGVDVGSWYVCDNIFSAARLLKTQGGMAGIVAKHLNSVPVPMVQRGDLVLAELGDNAQEVLGICIGVHAVFKGDRALIYFRTEAVNSAWRVG